MRPITGFVEQCCLLASNARVPAVELYVAYVHWCLNSGVPVQDQFTFLDMMESYGLKYRERRNGAWFRGIAILPAFRVDR
jgi:hypothetical protein